MCRPEELNDSPLTDADRWGLAALKAQHITDTDEGEFHVPPNLEVGEVLRLKLNRLAIMGMDVKVFDYYDVINMSQPQQEAYLAGARDAARYITRQTRSGGIA